MAFEGETQGVLVRHCASKVCSKRGSSANTRSALTRTECSALLRGSIKIKRAECSRRIHHGGGRRQSSLGERGAQTRVSSQRSSRPRLHGGRHVTHSAASKPGRVAKSNSQDSGSACAKQRGFTSAVDRQRYLAVASGARRSIAVSELRILKCAQTSVRPSVVSDLRTIAERGIIGAAVRNQPNEICFFVRMCTDSEQNSTAPSSWLPGPRRTGESLAGSAGSCPTARRATELPAA